MSFLRSEGPKGAQRRSMLSNPHTGQSLTDGIHDVSSHAPYRQPKVPRALFIKGLLILTIAVFGLNILAALHTMPTDRSPAYYTGYAIGGFIFIAVPIWIYLKISHLQQALREAFEEIENLRSRPAADPAMDRTGET